VIRLNQIQEAANEMKIMFMDQQHHVVGCAAEMKNLNFCVNC